MNFYPNPNGSSCHFFWKGSISKLYREANFKLLAEQLVCKARLAFSLCTLLLAIMQVLYNKQVCFFSNHLYLVTFIDLLVSSTAFCLPVLAANNNKTSSICRDGVKSNPFFTLKSKLLGLSLLYPPHLVCYQRHKTCKRGYCDNRYSCQ